MIKPNHLKHTDKLTFEIEVRQYIKEVRGYIKLVIDCKRV